MSGAFEPGGHPVRDEQDTGRRCPRCDCADRLPQCDHCKVCQHAKPMRKEKR